MFPRRLATAFASSVSRAGRSMNTTAASATPAAREAARAKRHLDDAKRRAFRADDLALPLRILRIVGTIVGSCAALLAVQTALVHAYAEHESPTPSSYDFWTRVDLRRALLQERYQHNPALAARLVERAVESETAAAAERGQALADDPDYLALVLRLAHAYARAARADDAVRVLGAVADELGARRDLVVASTVSSKSAHDDPGFADLEHLLARIETRRATLLVHVGTPAAMAEAAVAADRAVALGASISAAGVDGALPVHAAALLAAADVARASGTEPRSALIERYRAVAAELETVVAPVVVEEEPAAAAAAVVPFVREGVPRPPLVPCMQAIAAYHLGSLLDTAPSSSSSSNDQRDLVGALTAYSSALAHARTPPSAAATRPCAECAAATFAALGAVYLREGDEVNAARAWTEGMAAARAIDDGEAEDACGRGLAELSARHSAADAAAPTDDAIAKKEDA